MADYTPIYSPGDAQSHTVATSAVVGGRLVEVNATGTVGPGGDASTALVGVAAFSAAVGARVTVWSLPGAVHELVVANGAGVTAGDIVVGAAAGCVKPVGAGTFGQVVGIALTTAADAAKVRVLGR